MSHRVGPPPDPESPVPATPDTPPPGGDEYPRSGKPTPAILEWAKRQFTEEEAVAGLREIRETGGVELRDFVHELDQPAAPDERPAR
jgi:hypothetical protein